MYGRIMTTQTEPLPCPFCGGSAAYQQNGLDRDDRWYGCSCENWNCQGHNVRLSHKTALDAVKAWNTRAAIAADRAKRITGSALTTGQILAMERRSNMTDDETLRFTRTIESAVLAKIKEQS